MSQIAGVSLHRKSHRHLSKQANQSRKKFFDKYQWWFVALGLIGNAFFFVGSVCFLKQSLESAAIGLFITGSCFMLVSSAADSLAEYSKNQQE